MLEFLTQNLLWWHWIIFGLILLVSEIFTGAFIMLGLGLSAIFVGSMDLFYPISLETELAVWMILSVILITLWFKYFKDNSVENSGQSNYSLDTLGTVQEAITMNGRGKVKFDTPVLGNTFWHATAKEDIEVSSRIKIVEVKGQLIEVSKI